MVLRLLPLLFALMWPQFSSAAAFSCSFLFSTISATASQSANVSQPSATQTTAYSVPGIVTSEAKAWGLTQHYYNRKTPQSPPRRMNTDHLRISTYNVNMLEQATKVAKITKKINPDIQIMVEVKNLEDLDQFNKKNLGDAYVPFLLPGKDAYGRNVGLLIKKDLNIAVEYRSYVKKGVFSRDAPVALIYDINPGGSLAQKPKLAIMLQHMKSLKQNNQTSNSNAFDPTAAARMNQSDASVQIVSDLLKEFSKDLPVIMAGDFNNDIHQSSDFKAIFDFGFVDGFDQTNYPVPQENRSTYTKYSNKGIVGQRQIDAILSRGNILFKKVEVYKPLGEDGNPMSPAATFAENQGRASNHLPVFCDVQIVR